MGKRLIGSVGLKPGTDTGFDLDEKGQIHGYTDTQFALPVGDDDQVLTADSGEASGVKWAVAGGGAMELLASEDLGSAGANVAVTGTWTAVDYSYFIIKGGFSNEDSGATPSLRFRMNNTAGNDYVTNMILNTAGTLSATTSGFQTSGLIATTNVIPPSSTETIQVVLTLQLSEQNANNSFRPLWSSTSMWHQGTAAPSDTEQITGYLGQNSVSSLTKVDFFFSDGSDFTAASNLQLYGVKRT